MPDVRPVNIFIAYAHADEAFLRPLRKHLEVLEDDGVSIWYDGEILPGEEWDTSIKKRLKAADIILLLVSIDFLTSDYVKGTELPTALSRHAAGECTVVPVIVRNCLWQKKLGGLQALPKEAFPVENWPSRDSAYHNVAEGVEKVIEEIKRKDAEKNIADQIEILSIGLRFADKQEKENIENHIENLKISDNKEAKATSNTLNDPFKGQMILVNGGEYRMGGNLYGEGKPIHRVKVTRFFISKYAVTRKQWQNIMTDNPSRTYGDMDKPMGNVSWEEVQEFVNKLNVQTGKNYRLPTEAEWEYAAKGGNKKRKNYEFAGGAELSKVGWFEKNSGGKAQPVGRKEANDLGLYDMSGNVWEWCEDVWHDGYRGAPKNSRAWIEDGEENMRVVRGGSFETTAAGCRVGIRGGRRKKVKSPDIGFRLAHDYPM